MLIRKRICYAVLKNVVNVSASEKKRDTLYYQENKSPRFYSEFLRPLHKKEEVLNPCFNRSGFLL